MFIGFLILSSLKAEVISGTPIESKILGLEVEYSVYLPASYSKTSDNYPVIYLLHGLGNDTAEWVAQSQGNINQIMNDAIEKGIIPPAICIIPFAQDRTKYYYINSFDGKGRWEDMFYKEFIPAMEKTYRIKTGKDNTGIVGVSMGGYGALLHALKYPEMYTACAAFSPGIRTDEQLINLSKDDYNQRYGNPFGIDLTGQNRLTDYYKKYDILRMIKEIPAGNIEKVKFYINCGDVDFFTIGCCLLHIEMTEKKIPHVYNMGSGGHEWSYWKNYELDGLIFVAKSFKH